MANGASTISALPRRFPESLTGWLVVIVAGAALGLITAIATPLAQGVVGAALVSVVVCREVLRRASAQSDGDFLKRVVVWGIALRALFVVVHLVVALWFYGGGLDLTNYMAYSIENYERLSDGTLTRELFVENSGTTTGNVFTVVVFMGIALITGHTLWAMFVVSAAVSVAGSYLYYRAFQRLYPGSQGERFLMYALFLLPAVSFWSTYLGKDFVSFLLIGWLTYATAGLLHRLNVADIVGLVISAGLIVLLRAHIAIPIVGAVIIGLGFLFRGRQLPFFAKIIMAVGIAYAIAYISVGSLMLLGFREISVETMAAQAEFVHSGFVNTPATTALPRVIEDPSPASVLKFMPIGLFTLVFRPFIWEAHNVLAVAAGLENLVLIVLIVWRRRQLWKSLTSILREPFLLYCLLAFLGAGAVLSLNWNLGTMARHKTMIMPYLMFLLAGTCRRDRDDSREIQRDLSMTAGDSWP